MDGIFGFAACARVYRALVPNLGDRSEEDDVALVFGFLRRFAKNFPL